MLFREGLPNDEAVDKMRFPYWKIVVRKIFFGEYEAIQSQSTLNALLIATRKIISIDFFDIGLTLRSHFQIFEWILYKSSFKPDVISYNLLIDAYGQKSLYKEAESTYLELLDARCIPTEDTYALLLKAYCKSGSLEKAEAIFREMRKNGLPPSTIFFLPTLICLYLERDVLNF